jgi:uncharacterized repeat protein (TIGR01451 family)
LSVTVPASTPPLTVLTNTARIEPIPQDPHAANNVQQAATVVNLFNPTKTVSPPEAIPGDVVTYTITLANGDDLSVTARLTDLIPGGLVYLPGSSSINSASVELYDAASGSLLWQGNVPPHSTTTLRYQAQLTAPRGTSVTNTVQVQHSGEMTSTRQAVLLSRPYRFYLMLLVKDR